MLLASTGQCKPPNCVLLPSPFPPIDVTQGNSTGVFVSQYYAYGLGIIGGVAMILIMYGGYIILTSAGNPARVDKGRQYVTYAIAGLLLAIFGFVFMEVVAGGILHIPGIS